MNYSQPKNGVIKKQIKYSLKDENEAKDIENILKNENIVEQQQIKKLIIQKVK